VSEFVTNNAITALMTSTRSMQNTICLSEVRCFVIGIPYRHVHVIHSVSTVLQYLISGTSKLLHLTPFLENALYNCICP